MTPDELTAKLARLAELETEFEAAVERAKLAALYQLAYGLSHEFNNPLANISSRAQTLLLDEKDPERRRRLAAINAQAFRAHEMIADLMLFAKPPTLQKQEVGLSQLLEKLAEELRPLAAEQGSEVVFVAMSGLAPVFADPNYLAEAVKAVVKNALEALGEGGQVTLRLEEAPDERDAVAIVVEDNGPGIPREVREHLFDPYFSGREAGRGLGLGLSKCWRIVDEHGGRVEVESSPGRGATFRLWLPRSRA